MKNKTIEGIMKTLNERGRFKSPEEVNDYFREALILYGQQQEVDGAKRYRDIVRKAEKGGYSNEDVLFLRKVNDNQKSMV